MKRNKDENKIYFENFIAGALLKFEKLDNLDISLLLDDLVNANICEVSRYYYIDKLNGFMYFYRDGRLTTHDEKPLDFYIEEEKRTVREKYEEIAGKKVLDFFDKINVEEFKKRKEKLLKEKKELYINKGNVLLITDNEEEYEALKEYGFKNIDYFKSIIRADKYFSEHPEELKKYFLIIKGNQKVQRCCFHDDVELDKKLWKLRRDDNNTLFIPFINVWRERDNVKEVHTNLSDYKNGRSWEVFEETYSKVFDKILESAVINNLHDIEKTKEEFMPIEDYINPNRLTLPRKKSDLKLLYLDSININRHATDIANKLGLNIEFKEDNNSSLGLYIKNNLGNYDIIIVSDIYSRNILSMNNESTEQCKDTGRDLTLLLTYKDESLWYSDEDEISSYNTFGEEIITYHIFGGDLANNAERQKTSFRVLRKPCIEEILDESKDYNKNFQEEKDSEMKSIIENAVSIYNQKLIELGKPSLEDFDLKSAEDYDTEYDNVFTAEEERKRKALEPIRNFNELMYSIVNYNRYKKQGLIKTNVDGLKVTETPKGICVENILDGRTLCAITFAKEYKEKNLRVFTIQTLNNKGKLGNPEVVGVYTRKYENLESTPNRPTEKQMNAILSTLKKAKQYITPLNNEAWHKYYNLSEEEQKKLRKIK